MKESIFEIRDNHALTDSVFRMVLRGDTSEMTAPGQFVNLKLNGLFLRRPISLCSLDGDEMTLIYKVVGKGTAAMTELRPGDPVNVLTGLGNGYDLADAGDAPLLLGGGVGIPPLYELAKRLRAEGKDVTCVLGFNTYDEIFWAGEFSGLGCKVTVTLRDGLPDKAEQAEWPDEYRMLETAPDTWKRPCSNIIYKKGFVTDALPDEYSYFYTCGPEPMLRAVYRATKTSGQFSFEERMGCGFGACMGCSCRTVTGYKRICKDGPVLRKEEILWDA